MPAISASGGWGPGCQVPAHLAPGLPAFAQGLEGLGLGECSGLGFPCRARDGRHGGHTPREPSPVHKAEVLLQEAGVHGALAEFQPRLRVVVHVVDAHLLQDPKAPLRGGGDARQHWHISVAPRRCCPASPCGRCAHARTRAPAHHTRPDGSERAEALPSWSPQPLPERQTARQSAGSQLRERCLPGVLSFIPPLPVAGGRCGWSGSLGAGSPSRPRPLPSTGSGADTRFWPWLSS